MNRCGYILLVALLGAMSVHAQYEAALRELGEDATMHSDDGGTSWFASLQRTFIPKVNTGRGSGRVPKIAASLGCAIRCQVHQVCVLQGNGQGGSREGGRGAPKDQAPASRRGRLWRCPRGHLRTWKYVHLPPVFATYRALLPCSHRQSVVAAKTGHCGRGGRHAWIEALRRRGNMPQQLPHVCAHLQEAL